MKIGILTLPLHTNYGGILQAYALQTVLKRMGHEVKVIDRPWAVKIDWSRYPLRVIKRIILRLFFRKQVGIIPELILNRQLAIVEKYTKGFIISNIDTYRIKDLTNIDEKDFDAFIVGSDQIWRPNYCKFHFHRIENAFLEFAKKWNIKRVSYAASFGTDCWEFTESETTSCQELIQLFDAVSVRELSGVKLCADYLNRNDAEYVLDPTLLLSTDDYEKLIPNNFASKGNLMCYILDESSEINEFIDEIEKRYHLKAFRTNSKVEVSSIPAKNRIQPPIEQWLAGFRDAKLVITDSYHACVFSILFHKPFIAIGNKKRGYSRFESLLGRLGIEERLLENVNQFKETLFSPLSEDVYMKLNYYKSLSICFLKNSLNNE